MPVSLYYVRFHRVVDLAQRGMYPLLFGLLLAAVIPFFLLTHYAHPSADDFCYATLFRQGGFWQQIRGEYLGWKGRYSAIFFTAAYHKLGGMLVTYEFGLFSLLVFFVIALYTFVWSLLETAASKPLTLGIALGLAALYLGTMPSVPAGLYWIDGAFQYHLGNAFLMLALAALFMLYRRTGVIAMSLACLFIFLAIGTTEIAMIALVAVVGILAFNRMVVHGRDRLSWSLVIAVTVLSSALLVLAPGNAVRAEHASPEAGQFWFSFRHAWYHAGNVLAAWITSPGLWLATAAFVPAALRLVYLKGIRKEASWSRFFVILCLVPALVWVCHFGLFWAAATTPPGRALNMIYLIFLIGWFAGTLELVGTIARHQRLVFTEHVFPVPLRVASLAVMVLFGGFLLLQSQAHTALVDLIYRAPAYDQAMRDRYARIAVQKQAATGDERPVMAFPPIADPPRVLMYSDIQPDPGDWRNGCFARYFGLKSAVRR